jgi:hypothetical protein
MNRHHLARLGLSLFLAAGAAWVVSAQVQLPGAPLVKAGASINPYFDGWFDNADGSHSFVIGYFNRNTREAVDIPIGPNNYFEPGDQDRGQPTHFLPGRQYGVFTVTVPKDFPATDKIVWNLTVNGQSFRNPYYMHVNYNISPFKSSEESPNGGYNAPPVLKFDQQGKTFQGPTGVPAALSRTATVGKPMPIDIWADDDGLYSSGSNAERSGGPPPVNLQISKYRGPGEIVIAKDNPKFDVLKGGKPGEPFSGKAATTVTFSEPGDYMLHVTAGDYSGKGGGGSGCCWTTTIIKVSVTR